MVKVGLDVGSTTIKCVVIDENDQLLFSTYKRHFSHIKESIEEVLKELKDKDFIKKEVILGMSGSAGMGIAEWCDIDFIQEVYATRLAANKLIPGVDCIIELGGEDAKILFLSNGVEVRMNGTCAGGTGAFIDQMATLLNVDIKDINEMAKRHTNIYPIASRCGVFAKSDIQPLLNQGVNKDDIAASIFYAVANQTIGGLAQGREIKGKVVYLGGPLTFMSELRNAFDDILSNKGIFPDNSLYFVALGTAYASSNKVNLNDFIKKLEIYSSRSNYAYNKPLFNNEQELKEFEERHAKDKVDIKTLDDYHGPLYLGIDSGSTTLKFVLIDEDLNIRYASYNQNKGDPVKVIKDIFVELYDKYPDLNIKGSASTGYGEELAKAAFKLDSGIVETMAHFKSARTFKKDVDFIIDIGGQDIKCFQIQNETISNIFLNEACSSGCGSFLQTFANALGYEIEEFANLGLLAKKPVDLGSRCTVFMNSSVRQAQKDGATIDNISAGLSISVVKNALYKVIRCTSKEQLGKNIVVQGGTFLNKAVLRAFEHELNCDVVSPNISGLMGAYGAALYAKELHLDKSSTITKEEIKEFEHKVVNTKCQGCNNHCSLTINTFKGNPNRIIAGNRCEKPLGIKAVNKGENLYHYIRKLLRNYLPVPGKRGKIGIPLVLNMYELLPFWHKFFTTLGFEVYNSGFSDAKTYALGQYTIPSDTVCYPAKLVHGHIEKLLNEGFENIFYPCLTYNIDEHHSDNHYNCPIVAYYPENIVNNVEKINDINFIYDFLPIDDEKSFVDKALHMLTHHFKNEKFSHHEVEKATSLAYLEYRNHLSRIKEKAQEMIANARHENRQIIVLAGRPYQVDPQVNHGIDKLICDMGATVISEESVSHLVDKPIVKVLNQWTYHSRLYSAAKYCTTQEDMNLVQLVNFGCGLDAITGDECRLILENKGKIYTQIKIDEITNLGAVKIRLRSLFETLKGRK